MVFWKSVLELLRFLVKNAKNNIFEDKCFLSIFFIKLKCRRLQTGLAILKKHQTFEFFQTTDFLCNFQKLHFSEIFENHQ